MMQLIKSELCGKLGDDLDRDALSDDFLSQLYSLAKSHDLAHIVGSALKNNGLLPKNEIGAKFEKQIFMAIFRYENLNYEYTRICETLENEKITFVPLKGSVIRKLYPLPWLRTSCDIDILVKESDIDRTVSLLCEKLDYTADPKRHYHDVSLYSKNKIHLELHFNIFEGMDNIDPMLSRVFEFCSPADGKEFELLQSPEYLLFHHIAHMSYHFLSGGCGIRPFIDMYLINNHLKYDEKSARQILADCSLEKFFDGILNLTDVWFGNSAHTALTQNMENYILSGGVYGTKNNVIAMNNEKKGGKRKYLIHRIFMPYDSLKVKYPSLNGRRWLSPVYQIIRWFGLIFGGRMKHSLKELKVLQNIDNEKAEALSDLLYKLEI